MTGNLASPFAIARAYDISRTTMPRIVTATYRYKRPPRKRKAVPLEGPAIVRRDWAKPETPPAPANDDRKSAETSSRRGAKSAIVTAKRRQGRFGDAPDLTPEEHQRRGDAADRLFREIVRLATAGRSRHDTGAATAPSRYRLGGKPWRSHSGRSRRGSCGSPATGAASSGCSPRRTRRSATSSALPVKTALRQSLHIRRADNGPHQPF
jgi:hypothetical protein